MKPRNHEWLDPEATHAMGVAFETACQSLGLTDPASVLVRYMAVQIVDAALAGERNPVRLQEAALRQTLGAT